MLNLIALLLGMLIATPSAKADARTIMFLKGVAKSIAAHCPDRPLDTELVRTTKRLPGSPAGTQADFVEGLKSFDGMFKSGEKCESICGFRPGTCYFIKQESDLEEIPDIAGFRLYVIWDNGEMSKDLSQQKLVLSTSRRHGESTRARVDIVLEGYKGGTGNDPLEVSVHSQRINGETQDTTYKLPVGYFTENRIFRSIIVTHYCWPFEVNATLGQSHKTLNIEPWCGD
jgi:hypothetical protein